MYEGKCAKKCFKTKQEAKNFRKIANTMKAIGGKLTTVYFCDICSQYHLTSMPKQMSRDYKRMLNKKLNK